MLLMLKICPNLLCPSVFGLSLPRCSCWVYSLQPVQFAILPFLPLGGSTNLHPISDSPLTTWKLARYITSSKEDSLNFLICIVGVNNIYLTWLLWRSVRHCIRKCLVNYEDLSKCWWLNLLSTYYPYGIISNNITTTSIIDIALTFLKFLYNTPWMGV